MLCILCTNNYSIYPSSLQASENRNNLPTLHSPVNSAGESSSSSTPSSSESSSGGSEVSDGGEVEGTDFPNADSNEDGKLEYTSGK